MSESEAATAVTGPFMMMCGNPDCGGEGACDRIPERPTFAYKAIWDLSAGLTEKQGDEWALAMLADRFAEAGTDADTGVKRFIPDGALFTVHKGDRGLPEDERKPGWMTYTAVYSGAPSRAELMADAPAYEPEKAKARVNAMKLARGNDRLEKTEACWP
jgi:hypothetical protein